MTLTLLKSKAGLALFGASGMIAVAAFAGTTVITKAAAPAPAPTLTQNTQAEPSDAPEAPAAEAPGSTAVEPAGGPNDQSGDQNGPNDQSGVDGVE